MADPESSDPLLRIGTGYCRCAKDGLYFNSDAAFYAHRKGGECLSISEMLAKGMAVNSRGYWVTRLRDEEVQYG